MPKISIVVPIYNVEKYLARALDSILSQTFGDWEAILVNDGSPDRSAEIAEEYVNRDARFRLIHRENGGLSAARNTGMKYITGEYVMFLDSDDFLHPQAMELCLTAAERDNSDMVAYTYDHIYRPLNLVLHFLHLGDSTPRYRRYENPDFIVTEDIFRYATEYVRPKGIDKRWAVKHCYVWKCLYRASLIKDISFVEGTYFEDLPWWGEVLKRVERTTILNLPLYFYYPNPRSYLFSTSEDGKIESLTKVIAIARTIFQDAPEQKAKAWHDNFVVPFQHHLNRKLAKKRLRVKG